MGREGGGLYRTAEITNRAQDRVSPMISALAKNMQIVSQSFGLSVILCASERRLFASQVQNRAENCERHTHESVAGLLQQVQHTRRFHIDKKKDCLDAFKGKLMGDMG